MGWLEPLLLRIAGPIASWIGHRRDRRATPAVRLVADARRDGRMILREIKLARGEDASQALCGRIVSWYGTFELELAKVAPGVFEEFRLPGIPSGYVTDSGEVVSTPITIAVLRKNVKGDLRNLRAIHIRLTGSVARVKFLRWRRELRPFWRRAHASGGRTP